MCLLCFGECSMHSLLMRRNIGFGKIYEEKRGICLRKFLTLWKFCETIDNK